MKKLLLLIPLMLIITFIIGKFILAETYNKLPEHNVMCIPTERYECADGICKEKSLRDTPFIIYNNQEINDFQYHECWNLSDGNEISCYGCYAHYYGDSENTIITIENINAIFKKQKEYYIKTLIYPATSQKPATILYSSGHCININ